MGKALTLRNVPSEVMSAITKRSRDRGLSANRAVISLLEERIGKHLGPRLPERFHDLDSLAGRWSRDDGEAMERLLSGMREVDQELWR